MLDLNKLYLMDCMEGMAQFPDKYFELAIVDPPYGISTITNEPWEQTTKNPRGIKMRNRLKQGAGKLKNSVLQRMDSSFDFSPPGDEYFQELFRVSKNQIIWGGNYFSLPPTRGVICWDKIQPWENFSQFELAWTSFDCPAALYRYKSSGYIGEEKIHPTQKPIALYKWLLSKYAKPGDKILDTHVGSASSLIACYELNFPFVGFELNPHYYESASKRLSNVMAQTSLFDVIDAEMKVLQ